MYPIKQLKKKFQKFIYDKKIKQKNMQQRGKLANRLTKNINRNHLIIVSL